MLAITADKLLPQLPGRATLKELGYPITAGTIRGFTLPRRSKEAVTTMEAALQKSARFPDVEGHREAHIYEDIFLGSEQFSKFLRARMEEYREFYDRSASTR